MTNNNLMKIKKLWIKDDVTNPKFFFSVKDNKKMFGEISLTDGTGYYSEKQATPNIVGYKSIQIKSLTYFDLQLVCQINTQFKEFLRYNPDKNEIKGILKIGNALTFNAIDLLVQISALTQSQTLSINDTTDTLNKIFQRLYDHGYIIKSKSGWQEERATEVIFASVRDFEEYKKDNLCF